MNDSLPQYELQSALMYDYVSDDAHLVMSSTAGDIGEVHKYLAKGADIAAIDYGAVVGAAMNGHTRVLELLCAKGVVPDSALKEAWQFAKNSSQWGAMNLLEGELSKHGHPHSAFRPNLTP